MDLVQMTLRFMLATGASWVMWLLLGLSVLSVGVILERLYYFRKHTADVAALAELLRIHLRSGSLVAARDALKSRSGVEAAIVLEGLLAYEDGADSVAEAMSAAKAVQRVSLEEHLSILGTLGNNAPFIGLFGTVIGIIKAFHDLSTETAAGAHAVMAGISEALVATAIGLFVALPAVAFFNYFQRRIRRHLAAADGLMHILLADLRRIRR